MWPKDNLFTISTGVIKGVTVKRKMKDALSF
jgi:hypothetical protein